ncbi:hypothetical protein CVT25_009647 [Psilocybe cyanescens]|uniref:Uncharacterized protein n=1 Tax=Psilocybe cyanescens TaxID=93625 RepID=A0A409XGW9_PSICY|nr:hypothetical protein CVT25_009647 [Psilocybe cyanescens]
MSKSSNNLVFRDFLTSDVTSTKATAFSPDIIPHFGNKVDPALLTSEYDQFISLPLQPNEINNVYIRGQTTSTVTSGAKTAVVLRAVPSELILWPQAWNTTTPQGPGPLVINSSTPNTGKLIKLVASGTPFTITPSNLGGFNFALIATQAPVPTNLNAKTRLRDALPPPPPDAKNWQDLVTFFENDTSTVYYNVVVADPNAPVISVSTRLHVVDDGTTPLNFRITLESSTMPASTSVSLSSPSGQINLAKTPLADDIGVHVNLAPGFDDTITLNIFPGPEDTIETFAWISLQASIVVPQTTQPGGIPISDVILLGAQNIVFHDEATTNLKYASPAANKLKQHAQLQKADAPAGLEKAAVAVSNAANVTGSATGWWFRDDMGNPNLFPRTTTLSHSPDIQPVGTSPRSDVQTILGGANGNTDWSDANNVAVSQGAPNYIYIRGNCTLGNNYDAQVRLFCVPNALLLYPSDYSQFSVTDFDDDGDPFVAIRDITSTSANSFNVLDLAFDLLNPQPPPAGSDHYCLIAEERNPTADNPDPDWPHEDTGAFASGTGFNNWVGGTPTVCWRNITYKAGGAQMICTAIVTIPAGVYPSSAQWTLEVDAENAPVGSQWRLTGSGPAIPGVTIGFAQTAITAPNMTQGCHFTGLPASGYTFSVVLQWFAEGKAPGAGMNFSFLLFTTTPPAGANLAGNNLVKAVATLPDSAANWPFTVGIHHPGVENKGDGKKKNTGYLGHRFKEIGPNPWPYAKEDKTKKLNNFKSIGPTTVYSIGGDHWNFSFH